MQRLIIGVLVVVVLVVFGGNFYYARQLEKQLDEMAAGLQMLGGNLMYGNVAVGLGGDARIEDVLLFAPGFGEQLHIDRVVLRTGSVVGVHRLGADLRNQRLPERLGLSIEGMRLPTGGENYRQLDMLSAHGGESVSVAGCGERTHFNARDLINMGYTELVMDTHLDYRLLDRNTTLEISGRTLTRDLHEVSLKLDLGINPGSRDLTAIGMAMAGAELQALTVDFLDQGYVGRALEFCQKETGLTRGEFLERHLEAWQEAWQDKGFVAGANFVAAYRQFLERPGHFGVGLNPANPFSLMQLAAIPPELLVYQLQAELWVNHSPAGRLDLTVMDQNAEAARRERQRIYRELDAYDDGELEEIGIRRADIPAIARGEPAFRRAA
jgi:uncharacterized protein YjiS (DUF1127 family)